MLLTTLALTATLIGQTPPSGSQVKSVVDYYYTGSKAILSDAFLCKKITKDRKAHNRCEEPATRTAQKGNLIYVYMVAMVPKDAKATFMVQASHEGVVRETRDINMKGSVRWREWPGFKLYRAGAWTFKVMNNDGKTLKTLSIDVEDK